MNKTTLVCLVSAGLAVFPAAGTFAAGLNPTPMRESKVLADFESDAKVSSDPNGEGANHASLNTDTQFVAEGTKSLKLDVNGVTGWHDNGLVVEFPQPVDISGYQVLAVDVFLPTESLNGGDTSNTWWQFTPHLTLTVAGR